MDNTYYANPEPVSGLNNAQRYTMAIHWIGAGANLISGADLLHMDDLGRTLMYDPEVVSVADFTRFVRILVADRPAQAFCSQWPMRPLNPDDTAHPGGSNALQTQAWIAGPNESGTAVVVLANYGPDNGQGGYGTSENDVKLVSASLKTLGLAGNRWFVRRVLGGGGSGGGDHSDIGVATEKIESWLGPAESVMYKLQRQ